MFQSLAAPVVRAFGTVNKITSPGNVLVDLQLNLELVDETQKGILLGSRASGAP